MPVIPNFSAWGPSANTGANYIAGARTGASIAQSQDETALASQRIGQQAAQAQAQIGLANQKLQQQATLANMEFAAKQEQRQQAQLLDQQKLEIEKQYKITQLGLEKQRLDSVQQRVDIEAQKAARAFAVQQRYRQRFSELGGTEDAARQAAMEIGPEVGASAFSTAIRPQSAGQEVDPTIGTSTPAAGMPEGWSVFNRSRNSKQLVPPPKPKYDATIPPTAIPESNKQVLNTGQIVAKTTSPEVEIAKLTLRPLLEQDVKKSDYQEPIVAKAESGKKLTESEKIALKDYRQRKAKIAELRAIIMGQGGSNSTETGTAELPQSVMPKKRKWTPVTEE